MGFSVLKKTRIDVLSAGRYEVSTDTGAARYYFHTLLFKFIVCQSALVDRGQFKTNFKTLKSLKVV